MQRDGVNLDCSGCLEEVGEVDEVHISNNHLDDLEGEGCEAHFWLVVTVVKGKDASRGYLNKLMRLKSLDT